MINTFCMLAEDTRLMFIEDTPRVTGNTVTAEFVVGRDFDSVRCRVSNQEWRDCKLSSNSACS